MCGPGLLQTADMANKFGIPKKGMTICSERRTNLS